jgi:hypothetical protein
LVAESRFEIEKLPQLFFLQQACRITQLSSRGTIMCRNIKTLFNFEPPVTEQEIRAAALQFVRKVSGFNKPSKANEAEFATAVDEIAVVAGKLLTSLETNAPPKNRAEETAKARARAAQRFLS